MEQHRAGAFVVVVPARDTEQQRERIAATRADRRPMAGFQLYDASLILETTQLRFQPCWRYPDQKIVTQQVGPAIAGGNQHDEILVKPPLHDIVHKVLRYSELLSPWLLQKIKTQVRIVRPDVLGDDAGSRPHHRRRTFQDHGGGVIAADNLVRHCAALRVVNVGDGLDRWQVRRPIPAAANEKHAWCDADRHQAWLGLGLGWA